MKKLQTQLKTVSKNLAGLVKKLEKLTGDLEKEKAAAASKPGKKAAPAKAKKAKAVKLAKKVKRVTLKKKAEKAPKVEKSAADTGTVLDSVLDAIKKAKTGADIATLKNKTNLEARQLSNALYKLTKKGVIEARSRGVYFTK